MRLRFTPGDGFEIEGASLSVDAGRSQPLGIITHAHSDHIARHNKIICTPETALLLGERWKRLTIRSVPYRRPIRIDDVRVTFYPSGHMLGAAMILLETESTRVLFTGDLRTTRSHLFSGARPIFCDVLVTESTFGRPEYRFPAPARTKQLLHAFVDAARASGYTPVLTGYALGKAQELVALLADYHETIWVHPKIAAFCAVYRKAGIQLPPVEVPEAGAPPGALAVMPPNFERLDWREKISRPRVCFCSGWAVARGGGNWYRYDQAVPLSDHADCEGLVKFAKATGAAHIYTFHGFASELAELLRTEGLDAEPLAAQWTDPRRERQPQYTTETLDLFGR